MIVSVDDRALSITGRVLHTARLRDEPYECITEPEKFIRRLADANIGVDIFSFMQDISQDVPNYGFFFEWDSLAVLSITSYEHWWTNQINDKTRNMVRKAKKGRVDVRLVDFDNELVRGIMEIYNEAPLRQGKPFKHYGKSFETVKREHETFLERSDFIGAFDGNELIGLAKVVHRQHVSSLMQIISKICARNKAPTNALIAKSVELCAERKISYLHYGVWSSGGLGAFKKNHAFVRRDIPRYFIPITRKGKLLLGLYLHRNVTSHIPEAWRRRMRSVRKKWNTYRYGSKRLKASAV